MHCLLSLLVLFIYCTTLGQQYKGIVENPQGEPVPYCSVFIQNTTKGTVTNLKGQFYLHASSDSIEVIFRHPEYSQKNIVLYLAEDSLFSIILEYPTTELIDVVIRADARDPAYEIIEHAQKSRKKYLHQLEAYSCDFYHKCGLERTRSNDSLANDTSRKQHNFIESKGTLYRQGQNNLKEIIHAYNDYVDRKEGFSATISFGPEDEGPPTGVPSNPYLFRQRLSEPGFNFYHNLLDHPSLGTTPYISPISYTAMLSYDYRLDQTFVEGNNLVHKIEVIPKRRESATFSGYIYIQDGTWAIRATDLKINPRAMMRFKTFHLHQEYGTVNDSIWVTNEERYNYTSKEGKQQIFANTVIFYSNYQLNPSIEKNFFNNELRLVEDNAYDMKLSYWDSIRPMQLRDEERRFVEYQDSIIDYHQSPEYLNEQDSIYNQVKLLDFLLTGVGFRNWTKKQEIFFEPLIAQPRPFGVGGYRHNLGVSGRKEFKKGYAIRGRVQADYGFNNNDLKGSIETWYTYLPKRFGKIHLKVGDTYQMLNSYESISATFSRSNYIRRKGYTVGHSMELFNGFYADVDFEYFQNFSISGLDLAGWGDKLFGSLNQPKDFAPYNEVYLDVKLTYNFRQKYYNEPYKKVIVGSDYPEMRLWYKKGIKGALESIVDFDFIELAIEDDMQIGTLGESGWKVSAGTFLTKGNVQITNYKFFRRSDRYFFSDPLNSMQLLTPPTDTLNGFYPGVIATTNNYLQGAYIHHFNGALLNKIPLLNWLKLQAVVGANIMYVQNNNFTHLEGYVGVERPFKIREQLMKFGVYFVGADSNFSSLAGGFKIGINFYDEFNKKWMY